MLTHICSQGLTIHPVFDKQNAYIFRYDNGLVVIHRTGKLGKLGRDLDQSIACCVVNQRIVDLFRGHGCALGIELGETKHASSSVASLQE